MELGVEPDAQELTVMIVEGGNLQEEGAVEERIATVEIEEKDVRESVPGWTLGVCSAVARWARAGGLWAGREKGRLQFRFPGCAAKESQ